MVAGIAAPGGNERLQFARRVIERHGADVTTADGTAAAAQVLREALLRMVADYDTYFRDTVPGATTLRSGGLSSDTSIYAAFAVDAALKDVAAMGLLRPGAVRRVAVIGPGLDFTDKQEGYDFYPLQTIQPFAVIDSLRARNLAAAQDFAMTTYDLNPRVNDHIEAARQRAARGAAYTVQFPRDATQRWQRDLLSYWTRVGEKIGERAQGTPPPPAAGRVDVRGIRVRPDVVQAMTARDLNIVLQRPDPLAEGERFDLVVATNILVYYDVFEQSLALANIARMLRPGGILLANTPLLELPSVAVHRVGETRVAYTDAASDVIAWYRRE
jgi:SAM-dependent methyltransferase